LGATRCFPPLQESWWSRNELGQIDVYDLKSLEKRNLLTFPYGISAWSFSADGKRLFVLTANQMAYIFDGQSLDKAESTVAVGP
jgi:tricorn protease-like protein